MDFEKEGISIFEFCNLQERSGPKIETSILSVLKSLGWVVGDVPMIIASA